LESKVSEAVLHLYSGLRFAILKMYPLHSCQSEEVLDEKFEVFIKLHGAALQKTTFFSAVNTSNYA
jgi:hypothetical protein